MLGRICWLYGYSIFLSGATSLFVSGFSSLPLTKWDDKDGVPRADVGLVSVLLHLWLGVAVSDEVEKSDDLIGFYRVDTG